MGNDVVKAVTFFLKGSMPKELYSSLIVLIPKITNPTSVNYFKPISLCNIVYKIISKLLITKLRSLLDKLISPTQSALIPNRWIVENQIIVQEIVHSFKSQKTSSGLMPSSWISRKCMTELIGSSSKLSSSTLASMTPSQTRLSPTYLLFHLRSSSMEVKQSVPSLAEASGKVTLCLPIFLLWGKKSYPDC